MPYDQDIELTNILKRKCVLREDWPRDLFETLGDVEPPIRRAAAEALARRGDPRWIDLIKGEDEDLIRLADSDLPLVQRLLLPRHLDCSPAS